MEIQKMIPICATLWARLCELANIEVKTEAERIEEQTKARLFTEWLQVQNRLAHPILGFNPHTQTPLQNRVMAAAKTNSYIY